MIEEVVNATPEEQLTEARSVVEKMTRLLDDSDYKYLVQRLQEQINPRMHKVFVRPTGLDGLITTAYDNGEIAGLKIAQNFAEILKSGAEGTIELLSHIQLKEDE